MTPRATHLEGATASLFTTLRDRLRQVGYTVVRSDPADGAVTYFCTRRGFTCALPSLRHLEGFATLKAPK